jgi:hypothetical protein
MGPGWANKCEILDVGTWDFYKITIGNKQV